MIRILIVEDQTMLRDSLEQVIGGQDDMEVAGSTDDAADSPELCRKLQPDLVLMDVVTKNNSSGITYTAQIRKEFPEIKIVIMTAMPEITFTEEARKAGAHSFIDKDMGNDHLFHVIRKTMKGYSIYSGHSDRMPFTARFTENEISVIRFVCHGMERDEMAAKLGVSESMIRKHITSILDKTGFDSISKFAIYAVSEGYIIPEPLSKNSIKNI
ncbi:MAG: response regulator transcription factor [Treponema sp.]|nr:response regulator transcription factor [Treponema sp.]